MAFHFERLWLDGNLSFFRGMDAGADGCDATGLEQLVRDAIVRLEHASSLAGQVDSRLLDSRELRLVVDARCHCRRVRAYYGARSRGPAPAMGGRCSPSSPRFSFLTINENNG
jgi:hypothetical protein